eukprot:Blabericola_migrator_1__7136@NODE_3614_length_1632_cov_15_457508_g2242_i0_p2_GENE_NODE_3614_length_1632_cov_15_457508_g2242_i0NODE_3614_length_1632_cov_15_457508_g2242_i0_p2_ORF_typecomplete_len104_score9_40_NODE_3614_length_1632_cov_15_457508_g2242_i010401351
MSCGSRKGCYLYGMSEAPLPQEETYETIAELPGIRISHSLVRSSPLSTPPPREHRAHWLSLLSPVPIRLMPSHEALDGSVDPTSQNLLSQNLFSPVHSGSGCE